MKQKSLAGQEPTQKNNLYGRQRHHSNHPIYFLGGLTGTGRWRRKRKTAAACKSQNSSDTVPTKRSSPTPARWASAGLSPSACAA